MIKIEAIRPYVEEIMGFSKWGIFSPGKGLLRFNNNHNNSNIEVIIINVQLTTAPNPSAWKIGRQVAHGCGFPPKTWQEIKC